METRFILGEFISLIVTMVLVVVLTIYITIKFDSVDSSISELNQQIEQYKQENVIQEKNENKYKEEINKLKSQIYELENGVTKINGFIEGRTGVVLDRGK